jgi:hypothetical protein
MYRDSSAEIASVSPTRSILAGSFIIVKVLCIVPKFWGKILSGKKTFSSPYADKPCAGQLLEKSVQLQKSWLA